MGPAERNQQAVPRTESGGGGTARAPVEIMWLPTAWVFPPSKPEFQKLPQSLPQSPREERQHTI